MNPRTCLNAVEKRNFSSSAGKRTRAFQLISAELYQLLYFMHKETKVEQDLTLLT
jgi:hypothetical protein